MTLRELTGKVFDILDFEVREPDKKKGKAWMRMQVRYEDMGDDGKPVVKTRLVKGFHVAICEFLKNMTQYINKTSAISGMSYEETFKKTLPFEDCEVENRNGWCIKGYSGDRRIVLTLNKSIMNYLLVSKAQLIEKRYLYGCAGTE